MLWVLTAARQSCYTFILYGWFGNKCHSNPTSERGRTVRQTRIDIGPRLRVRLLSVDLDATLFPHEPYTIAHRNNRQEVRESYLARYLNGGPIFSALS